MLDINNLFSQELLRKKINKSGLGHCIYMPKKVLDLYGLKLKDEVELILETNGILIRKVEKEKGKTNGKKKMV